MGHLLSRRASLRAFVVPDVVSTHGLTRCFALIFAVGQGFFDRTLRFDLNALRALAHTSLTALARSAQWSGIYAWHLDALVRIGALTILTGMAQVCAISRMQRLLHLNFKSCITEFQPTPAHASHSSNSPAHAHMF